MLSYGEECGGFCVNSYGNHSTLNNLMTLKFRHAVDVLTASVLPSCLQSLQCLSCTSTKPVVPATPVNRQYGPKHG